MGDRRVFSVSLVPRPSSRAPMFHFARQQSPGHWFGHGPSEPNANRGADGSIRSMINSWIIFTSRG